MTMGALARACFLILFVFGSIKRSAARCATHCSGINSKFHYRTGNIYRYRYKAENLMSIRDAKPNSAIIADVQVSTTGNCEYTMKIINIDIHAIGERDRFDVRELEQYDLAFAMDEDGIQHVCPFQTDPVWSVNIKRGILSTFQNTFEGKLFNTVEETDVSGTCTTHYEEKDKGLLKVYEKSKEVSSCKNRVALRTAIQMVPYTTNSQVQNAALFSGTKTCHQEIEKGVVTSVICSEHLTPLIPTDAVIEINSRQNMELIGTSKGSLQSNPGQAQPLYFDPSEHQELQSREASQIATQSLHALASTYGGRIGVETPSDFTELVSALRKMPFSDIQLLKSSLLMRDPKHVQENFLASALPMCGTADCVLMAVNWMQQPGCNEQHKNMWLDSLPFIPNPSKEVVQAVVNLIGNVPTKGLLSISSLINNHCKQSTDCTSRPDIQSALQRLQYLLGSGCKVHPGQEIDKIIHALKALGNIGVAASDLRSQLRCMQDVQNPVEIRIAAIQSFRRIPCHPEASSRMLTMFRDIKESVEIRLSAFIVLMKCPTHQLIEQAKEVFDKEHLNQVRSFVSSYVNQIQHSDDPEKAQLRQMLRTQFFDPRSAKNPRQFSRYMEVGRFSQETNFGGHADIAAIFVPESPLPRLVSVNVTVDLFGKAVNVLEIGGRMKGFDRVLESLIGHHGYFSDPEGYYLKASAPLTHPNPAVNRMTQQHQKEKVDKEKVDLSLYMRVFGNEIMEHTASEVNGMAAFKNALDLGYVAMMLAKGRQVHCERSLIIVDSSVTFATQTGIPTTFSFNGTASVNVTLAGKFDITKLLKMSASLDVSLAFSPTVSVATNSLLTMQIKDYRSGAGMISNAFTSNEISLSGNLKDGNSLKFKVALPMKRMDFIHFERRFARIQGHISRMKRTAYSSDGLVCTQQTSQDLLGVKLCRNKVSRPRGEVKYEVYAEKTDPTLTALELDARWGIEQILGTRYFERTFSLVLSAPGAAKNRDVRFEWKYAPEVHIFANLTSPWKTISLKAVASGKSGSYTNQYRTTLTVDRQPPYQGTLSSREVIESVARKSVLISGTLSAPGRQTASVYGSYTYETNVIRWIEGKLEHVLQSPLSFKAFYVNEKSEQSRKGAGIGFESPAAGFTVEYINKPEISPKGNERGQHGERNVTFMFRTATNQALLSHQCETHRGSSKAHLTWKSEFSVTQSLNSRGSYIHVINSQKADIDIDGKFGSPYEESAFMARVRSDKPTNKVTAEASFRNARLRGEYTLNGLYQQNLPSFFHGKFELKTPAAKTLLFEASHRVTRAHPLVAQTKSTLEYNHKGGELVSDLQEMSPQHYVVHSQAFWQRQKKADISTEVTATRSRDRYNYDITSNVQVTNEPTLVLKYKVLVDLNSLAATMSAVQERLTLYDLSFDGKRAPNGLVEVKGSLRSNLVRELDVSGDAVYTPHRDSSEINWNAQRQGRQWGNGRVVFPKSLKGPNIHSMVSINWDMIEDPKELAVEYTGVSTGSKMYKLNVKAGDRRVKYESEFQRISGPAAARYAVNVKKDGRDMIGAGLGYSYTHHEPYHGHGSDSNYKVDGHWRTGYPLEHRDWILMLEFKNSSMLSAINGKLVTGQRPDDDKAELSVNIKRPSLTERAVEAELFVMAMGHSVRLSEQLKSDSARGTKQASGNVEWNPSGSGPGAYRYRTRRSNGTQVKRFSHKIDWTAHPWTLNILVETANPRFRNLNANFRLSDQHDGKVLNSTVRFNDRNVAHGAMIFGHADRYLYVNSNITSIYPVLKLLNVLIKHDLRHGILVERRWAINDDFLVALKFQESKTSRHDVFAAGFEFLSKPRIHWKLVSRIKSHKERHRYDADVSFVHDSDEYRLNGRIDGPQNTGSLRITHAGDRVDKPQTSVRPLPNSEFELVAPHSHLLGHVTLRFRLKPKDHELSLEFQKQGQPMNAQYTFTWLPGNQEISARVSSGVGQSAQQYGFMVKNAEPDPKTNKITATVTYPARKIRINAVHVADLPTLIATEIDVDLSSHGDTSDGTSLKIKYTWDRYHETEFDAQLNDPVLPDGLRLIGHKHQSWDCATVPQQPCNVTLDGQLVYSRDPSKAISAVFSVFKDLRDGFNGYGVDTAFRHDASGTDNRILLKFKSKPYQKGAGLPEMDYEILVRTIGDDLKKRALGLTFKNGRDRVVYVKVNALEDEWTATGQTESPGRRITISRNSSPMYTVLVRSDKPGDYDVEVKDAYGRPVVHSSADLVSKNEGVARIWHFSPRDGTRVDDVEAGAKLLPENVLEAKLYVRPELQQDIKDVLRSRMEKLKQVKTDDVAGSTNVKRTYTSLRRDLSSVMKPLGQKWAKEIKQIQNELGKNERMFQESLQKLKELYRELKSYFSSADFAALRPYDRMKQIADAVKFEYQKIYAVGQMLLEDIRHGIKKVKDLLERYQRSLQQIRTELKLKIDSYRFTEKLQSLKDEMTDSELARDLQQFFADLRSMLPGFSFITEPLRSWYNYFSEMSQARRRPVQIPSRFDRTEVVLEKLKPLFKAIFPKLWKQVPIGKLPDLKMYSTTYWSHFLPLFKSENVSNGLFTLEIPLPRRVDNLQEAVCLLSPEELPKLMGSLKEEIVELSERVEGYLMEATFARRPLSEWSLFPTHRTTALILGSQHYITFDQVAYDFAAECSYLLARDFEENTFTISIDYQRSPHGLPERQAVIFEYLQNNVKVFSDGRVLINNRAESMPWQAVTPMLDTTELAVTRPTPFSVMVRTDDNIRLFCCFHGGFCMLTLPGKYFGKSAGLFGVNDFEPSNDMTLPDSRNASNLGEFASQWSTAPRCAGAPNVADPRPVAAAQKEVAEQCNSLFAARLSPLRYCFSLVEPKPFLHTCLSIAGQRVLSRSRDANPADAPCNASAAYVAMCKTQGLEMTLPDVCVKCIIPHHPILKAKDSVTLKQQPREVDIVLAVDEKGCLHNTPSLIDGFAQTLDTDLRRHGFDVRFVLSGYNGGKAQQQFHIISDEDGVQSVDLSTLRRKLVTKLPHETQSEKQAPVDGLSVLDKIRAVNPFRYSSAKFVVLFACGACTAEKVSARSVLNKYLEEGITPFLTIRDVANVPKDSQEHVLSMEAGSVLTDKRQRPVKQEDVAVVAGLCPELVMQLNGTVIDQDQLTHQAVKERLVQKIVARVGENACLVCSCEALPGKPMPRTVCRPCVQRTLVQII